MHLLGNTMTTNAPRRSAQHSPERQGDRYPDNIVANVGRRRSMQRRRSVCNTIEQDKSLTTPMSTMRPRFVLYAGRSYE